MLPGAPPAFAGLHNISQAYGRRAKNSLPGFGQLGKAGNRRLALSGGQRSVMPSYWLGGKASLAAVSEGTSYLRFTPTSIISPSLILGSSLSSVPVNRGVPSGFFSTADVWPTTRLASALSPVATRGRETTLDPWPDLSAAMSTSSSVPVSTGEVPTGWASSFFRRVSGKSASGMVIRDRKSTRLNS